MKFTMRRFIGLARTAAFASGLLCSLSPLPSRAAASIVGTWAIHGKLVTSVAMNPNDRYAPKEGQDMVQTWKITKTKTGFALITPKGTVPGTGTGTSAHFKVRFPASIMGASCQIQVTVDVKAKSASSLSGSEELLYFVYNGLGQLNPVPGREAWAFTAKRKK